MEFYDLILDSVLVSWYIEFLTIHCLVMNPEERSI